MKIPEKVSIGDKYGPAMAITDPAEAREYFEACVAHNMSFGSTREEAERIERANLGYYAGYYDEATMKRVKLLYGASHPIFGDTYPAPEEAFAAGVKAAERGAGASSG